MLELTKLKLVYNLLTLSAPVLPSIVAGLEKSNVKYNFVQTICRREIANVGSDVVFFNNVCIYERYQVTKYIEQLLKVPLRFLDIPWSITNNDISRQVHLPFFSFFVSSMDIICLFGLQDL